MLPISLTVGPLAAASANSIVTSVTPTAGQTLTLTTSPFTMDRTRQVLFTYGIESTARTLTLTGTDRYGMSQFETITVPINAGGGAVASVLDYATVTKIVSNSAFTNAITVGTNGVAGSAWASMDSWADPSISAQANVTGTVNYTVQTTLDNTNSATRAVLPVNVVWINWTDIAFVGATTSLQSVITLVPAFVRIVLNSGTGSVTLRLRQSGSVAY